MKTLVAKLALFALASALHCNHSYALTPSEIFAKTSPSIWGVKTYDKDGLPLSSGSAVVIAPETLITNCHVLKKSSRITLTFENISLGATLEMWDTVRDLCQIKAKNLNAPAIKFGSTSSLVVGQNIFTIGNPKGLELTLGSGLVSSLRKNDKAQLELVQISAPISPGSSGGGLFDEQARLVGITTLQVTDGQNLNFAVPVEWIKELPGRHQAARNKEASEKITVEPSKPQAPQAKVWKYLHSPLHGRKQEILITEQRGTDASASLEEASVNGDTSAAMQWPKNPPLFRMRSANRVEWIEVSPALFNNTAGNQSLRSVSLMGDAYNVSIYYTGEEQISIAGKSYKAKRLELRGKKEHMPDIRALYAFTIKAWYSEELGRVVKTQFVSTLMNSQLADRSETIMTAIPE